MFVAHSNLCCLCGRDIGAKCRPIAERLLTNKHVWKIHSHIVFMEFYCLIRVWLMIRLLSILIGAGEASDCKEIKRRARSWSPPPSVAGTNVWYCNVLIKRWSILTPRLRHLIVVQVTYHQTTNSLSQHHVSTSLAI